MTSQEIQNQALMLAGLPPVTDRDAKTPSAEFIYDHYPVTVRRLLRDHVWGFAVKFIPLARLNAPCLDPNYGFIQALPVDCLRVLAVTPGRYRVCSNQVFTTEAKVTLEYVAEITDATRFDAMFADGLMYALAAEIAAVFAPDMNKSSYFEQQAMLRLQNAKTVQAQENAEHLQPRRRSRWLESRR